MIIRAVPEYWRAKWSSLKRIASLPLLPEMDGAIADLHQKADELMAVAEGVFESLDTWVWSHELQAAMFRLKGLSMICDTEITATFEPTEALFVPGFREDFHAWWADAGQVAS